MPKSCCHGIATLRRAMAALITGNVGCATPTATWSSSQAPTAPPMVLGARPEAILLVGNSYRELVGCL